MRSKGVQTKAVNDKEIWITEGKEHGDPKFRRFVSMGKLEKGTKRGFKIRGRLEVDEAKMDNTRGAEAGWAKNTKSIDDKYYFRRSLEFWGCARVNMVQH
jgi:hypothetical protein